MEATESSMGFGGRAISFQSGAINCTGSEMVPMENYFGMSNCTSSMGMVAMPSNPPGMVQVQACNSPGSSSLLLESGPSFKHDTGLAVDWSVEEQYRLEEGLQKYSDEPSIMRYVKIAASLPDKTVRDVALRCRWMTRKRRKPDDYNAGRKTNNRKDKLAESSPKMNMSSSPLGQNLSVYPLMMQNTNQTGSLPFQGISGTSRHLLEQNIEAFSQISANLSSFKFQDNIDLFCLTRNNIIAVLNDMSEMPGIMSHMPPLPVSLNDDLANSLLPSTTQSMMFRLPSGMQLKHGGFPPLGAHGPFQPTPAAVPAPLAGWMSNPSVAHPSVSGGAAIGLGTSSIPAALKHPRTPPTNPSLDYASGDPDHVAKRTRPMGITDEVNLPVNVMPVSFPGHGHSPAFNTPDDLPKVVSRSLNQGSSPMSMDFHPAQQTLLLVGTNVGDIGLWEVGSRERLVLRNFKVWDLSACSMPLQSALVKDPAVSVNRVIWSPDGNLFGVAYSRHIVQIYSYHGGDDVRQHLEIDAHVGGVNDIAFSTPNKQLCVITCGDDKLIKVWDAGTGAKQYTFEGHEAPVYSVCPHYKENIQFIFSTALDGKIKAWLYDNLGSRVDYEAPGRWCTTMAYSADGTRLFSCGTSKDGESYIVEWNESEGAVKKHYQGFRKRSLGVVQFDTMKNRYLAAGDEFVIKFWDMDNVQLLTSIDADGGLPASPRIRFNKDGTLLAVSGNDNVIKVLANNDGTRLLRTFENLSYDTSRASEALSKPAISPISAAAAAAAAAAATSTSAGLAERANSAVNISGMNGDARNLGDVKPRIAEESNDKSKIWKLTEINEPAQCRTLRLPENLRVTKISRLIYTNSGNAILALASNAIHLLWKWQRNDRNSTGKVTAGVSPQLWQPSSGILMTNDVTDTNPEDSVSCFALSKNDSYVMSASGGKISLFNMMTFKTMTTFMPPPPAATFLAFHPQDNNIIAIGMDDSTIQIYNVRVDEVKSKLKGHSKRITGLAFSHVLNVLVSSGADAQICVWSSDGWEKQKARLLQVPAGRPATAQSDTRVQFHQDQTHFLVVHETQLAIYEASKLECVKQWLPREPSAPISHATFSCDSQLVYASFLDASICVFSAANLRLRCRINPSAYLPANVSVPNVHPLVIAAHPQEPNQFAIGLSDGGVHVFEPVESEGKWGVPPPPENGSVSSATATPSVGASGSEQAQR